jgi:hypothetical protein
MQIKGVVMQYAKKGGAEKKENNKEIIFLSL